MKKSLIAFGIAVIVGCLALDEIVSDAHAAGAPPVNRLSTDPGTPALIAAGTNAAELAEAALHKTASTHDAAANPTTAASGVPPPLVDGNFLIGPVYARAAEFNVNTNVPHGTVRQFSMASTNSKFYNPGIMRDAPGTPDPNNPKTLIVRTHAADYQRAITVYIPSQYVPGMPAPLLVVHDGPTLGRPDLSLPHVLDNLIAQHRVPAMIVVMIANGGGDAQGNERGLEYDTMSGKYAEFIEAEVLPLVEKNYQVKLTKDPEARAAMGTSSGGAAALAMAWYHPEWYHRVIAYSGTFVNQQWPFNPETPDGAWDFHEKLIPHSAPKPLRLWLEVGDRDLLNPNALRDGLHDWVAANNRMAAVLKAKGYHYQYVYALNAGHGAGPVRNETLPEALEWAWQGCPR
jgi:enterochelin esterase-like enzyme